MGSRTFEILRAVRRQYFAPLKRMAKGIVRRTTLSSQIHTLKLPTATAGATEGIAGGDVEQFQQYGLASHVPDGAEAIMLAVGADPSHQVIIVAADRSTRPVNLLPGEVLVFSQHLQRVLLGADGKTNIGTDGTPGALAIARVTSDVGARAAMTAWAVVVETFINGLAPGTFIPANDFTTSVVAANAFGEVTSGSGDADIT